MSGPFGAGALQFFSGAGDFYSHKINQSLRFEDGNSASLSRTNSSAGNRRTWTFSAWVKRSNLGSGTQNYILGATTDNYNVNWAVFFFGSDELTFYSYTSSQQYQINTTGVFRDPSAWYHIVLAWDTTQSTDSNRIKLYVNGEQVTAFDTAIYPSLNYQEGYINNNIQQDIGRAATAAYGYDGYMAEVNFIDGQALAPTSFGETKAGIWIPKDTSGLTFGTNGFRLTFAEAGDLGANSSYTVNDIFGDSSAVATYLFDGSIVDAGGNYNGTATNVTFTDGIVGTQAGVFNGTNAKWVAGTHLLGTSATNSNYSISGWFQVSANYQYLVHDGNSGSGGGHFAIYTNGSGGLDFSTGDSSGTNSILVSSSQTVTDGQWHHFTATKSVSSGTATGKLWVDGNYAGSDTTTSTIAFSNETAFAHFAYANTYYSCVLDQIRIFNRVLTDAEVQRLAGGYGLDSSGNANTFTPVGLQSTDVVLDSPTNNWATMNPLDGNGPDMQEGNLKPFGDTASSVFEGFKGTFPMSSGKWYWEVNAADVNNLMQIGITPTIATAVGSSTNLSYHTDAMIYNNGGTKAIGTGGNGTSPSSKTTTSYGASYTDGDIIGVALDLDSSTTTLTFYKNNSSQGTAFSSLGESYSDEFVPLFTGIESSFGIFNFGQDSSFAGTKTAQGNTDSNGVGDFYYSPPSGYLACCSANLPDPGIDPAQDEEPADHFNTVLYTGDGSGSQAITGVGFQPDWVWVKARSIAYGHRIYDSVRGATKRIQSNSDNVEATENGVTSFDSDGFTAGHAGTNGSSQTFVAWNWLAGGSAVTNNDGSVTSSVSANTKAGFSIVTHDNGSGTRTVGHGLNSTPELIIEKKRDSSGDWLVQYTVQDGTNDYLRLNQTDAKANGSGASPTSSVYTPNVGGGADCLAYCFHSVDGYSKIGRYTGNGSTDGPYIYTGFRLAFLIIKRASSTADWIMFDNKRDVNNELTKFLYPNLDIAEATGSNVLDFLSNGFKLKNAGTGNRNASGNTYIYLAFAEQPFKYSNAL